MSLTCKLAILHFLRPIQALFYDSLYQEKKKQIRKHQETNKSLLSYITPENKAKPISPQGSARKLTSSNNPQKHYLILLTRS